MKSILLIFILSHTLLFELGAQKLEAAYSQYDDVFDEWRIHINKDYYVEAIRQFGSNPYRKWNLVFETEDGEILRGFMQRKWADDVNYWDFFMDNENLSIQTIYRNDIQTWKIEHGDRHFTITAENNWLTVWKDRFHKDFDWEMYMVDEGFIHDWYIDDDSTDQLTFYMRIAAAMIVLELICFGA